MPCVAVILYWEGEESRNATGGFRGHGGLQGPKGGTGLCKTVRFFPRQSSSPHVFGLVDNASRRHVKTCCTTGRGYSYKTGEIIRARGQQSAATRNFLVQRRETKSTHPFCEADQQPRSPNSKPFWSAWGTFSRSMSFRHLKRRVLTGGNIKL